MWNVHHAGWGNTVCNWFPGAGSWFSIGPHGYGPFFLGWLVPLLFWAVVLYALISVFRYIMSRSGHGQKQSAMETLQNRFAAGEISEQDYLARKAVLKKG